MSDSSPTDDKRRKRKADDTEQGNNIPQKKAQPTNPAQEKIGGLFSDVPDDVARKIGGLLTASSNIPFLPELPFVFQEWLPCWGPDRLFHILEEDRTHFQTPALQRFEQLRRRIRDKLVGSIHNL